MDSETPLLHKKDEVCTRLRVSPRCLEVMVATERFPRGVQIGRCVYWSDKTLQAWIRREFGAQEGWRPQH